MIGLLVLPLAFKPPPSQLSRRAAVTAAVSTVFAPLSALADGDPLVNREGGALAATCLGFGCNPYGDLGFNGMPADKAPPGSLPYPEFLNKIKEKKVEGVVFEPPMGDVAYALIDGKAVRIGEGWPTEVANSWSSPTWVVRILENEGVPYKFNFDLKMGTASGRSGKVMTKAEEKMRAAEAAKQQGYAYNPYVPDSSKRATVLETTSSKTGMGFKSQPKMYGGADMGLVEDTPDYTGNTKASF